MSREEDDKERSESKQEKPKSRKQSQEQPLKPSEPKIVASQEVLERAQNKEKEYEELKIKVGKLENENLELRQRAVRHFKGPLEETESRKKLLKDLVAKLKGFANIDDVASHAAHLLRSRNLLKAKIIKHNKGKRTDDYFNLIADGMKFLTNDEIDDVLEKGKDDPFVCEVVEADVTQINDKVRTEKEYHDIFSGRMKRFVPKLRYFDRDYIHDIMMGSKKLFKLSQINYCSPPKTSEFTIEGNAEKWSDKRIACYLPPKCGDRDYMFTILNTVYNGVVDKAIENAEKNRNEDAKMKRDSIKMEKTFFEEFTKAIANSFTRGSSRHSLTKKLTSKNLGKEPTERKRKLAKVVNVVADGSDKKFSFGPKKLKPD